MRPQLPLFLLLLSASGCTGNIDELPPVVERPPLPPGRPAPGACDDSPASASVAPMRRLSAAAIDRTLGLIFGEPSSLARRTMRGESGGEDFVSDIDVERQIDLATSVGVRYGSRLGCGAECGDRVRAFGRRLWRRALTEEEVAGLMRLSDPEERLTHLVASPNFHYVVEPIVGEPDEAVALEAWAVATRLAFALTGAGPDDALLDAAERRTLTGSGLRAQAERLLDSPRGREHVHRFFADWLGASEVSSLEKDADVFPDWSSDTPELLVREMEHFVDEVLDADDGSFDTLVSAPWSMMNEPLENYFGIEGVRGDEFRRVPRDRHTYAGILTSGAFLAAQARPRETSPLHRGIIIREAVFCGEVPAPPRDVLTEFPPEDPTKTTRERMSEHRANPACSVCHDTLDPPGFALRGTTAPVARAPPRTVSPSTRPDTYSARMSTVRSMVRSRWRAAS